MIVDAAHLGEDRAGVIGRAESGDGDEARGAAQAALHVVAKARMVPHSGEHLRMKHLQEQRGDPADEHRGYVAVHAPGDRIGREQRVVAALHRRLAARLVVEQCADLPDDEAL